MTVALTGYGLYRPEDRVTGEEIAAESGIPEDVVVEKMGVREKRVCRPDTEHVTDMCVEAGHEALADAGIEADAVDLVLYHGSEYKDYYVWSAAANAAERLGAESAYATENYTLCAGTPVALRGTKAQLLSGSIDVALHVTASREEDLVDYENTDASFMFNFGSGGAAYVLESEASEDRRLATVRESAAVTDGSFSEDVVMPAGGSRNPPSRETVEAGMHTLTVPDPDGMKERLGPVSAANFLDVAETALSRSGYEQADVDFLALTHMKRSFTELLCERLSVDFGSEFYYLDEYGHVQSVDQFIAIDEGLGRGLLEPGDLILFLAAGTGYTWAASVLEWEAR